MKGNHRIKIWHGIPRDDINWYPIVKSCLCDGCGLCVTTCPNQALSFDFEMDLPFVDMLRCMVGCSICASVCSLQAIVFPDPETLHKMIECHQLDLIARQQLLENKLEYNGVMPQTFGESDLEDLHN